MEGKVYSTLPACHVKNTHKFNNNKCKITRLKYIHITVGLFIYLLHNC